MCRRSPRRSNRKGRERDSRPEALAHLLADTGLRFEFLNPRTVRIYAQPPLRPTVSAAVAIAPERRASGYRAAPTAATEEVIVTATRRAEHADKVPMSITVWTEQTMAASGVKGMTQIGALTPGVEFDFFPDFGSGIYTNIATRGITDRNGTTSGIYLDETALPAGGQSIGRVFPVTFDLDRVEVLRGPQGALLGQGTLGGAVRFIMSQPSLTTFSGRRRLS